MKTIPLSICIPTYNFGKFIGETLDSIIPQLSDEVELVIIDGASTDNTESVVRSYMQKSSQIHYYRQKERGGIDRDMHLSVEYARGEYCWLFSSDDVMYPGVVSMILSEIRSALDVYVCGFDICTLNIEEVKGKYPVSTLQTDSLFDLSCAEERLKYFRSATTLPAFFSFLSSVIVKRECWMQIPVEECFLGTHLAHVPRIFRMIERGLKLKYLPKSLLKKRSENDSFMDKGLIHRLGISIYGYHQIADHVFGSTSPEAKEIRRTIRNEILFKQIIEARACVMSSEEKKALLQLVKTLHRDTPFSRFSRLLILHLFSSMACRWIIHTYRFGKRCKQGLIESLCH